MPLSLDARLDALAELGHRLAEGTQDNSMDEAVRNACAANPWFTEEHIRLALRTWGESLSKEGLQALAGSCPHLLKDEPQPRLVAIVMAGNLPLVGMHDWLCVLLAGHKPLVKLSSSDSVLLPYINNLLPSPLRERTCFAEGRIRDFEAIIATGSNNTNRYFEYYFSRYPHIIRHSRHSAAILDGSEEQSHLERLCDDIFLHFGLGCRSVSRLLIPKGYDFEPLLEASGRYAYFADMHIWHSSLDYHKTLLMLNGDSFVDGGFWLLRPSPALTAPVGMVNYGDYDSPKEADLWVRQHADELQLALRKEAFGTAQHPALTDFADGVNTLHFLATLP